MSLIPKSYLSVLKDRDFFLLTCVIFIGQFASAFLMLALVVSVFAETKSNFGVSGVIASFTVPGFLLMAIAGLAADIFDRKKIILLANTIITLVVLLILFSIETVYASIPLSFLYFAGNVFFYPASAAASAQLVKKKQLLAANSIYIFTLSGGIILGLFLAAVVHFFLGNRATLVICEILLIAAAVLSVFLPPLIPRKIKNYSVSKTLSDIWSAFIYIFNQKLIWFFFLIFALMQGIIAFGVTLAPGFFDEVVGLSINKSPIFIFPFIGFGVLLGLIFVHNWKLQEGQIVTVGIGTLGFATLVLGLILRLNAISGRLLLVPVGVFLVLLGFAVIDCIIASRTVMQKKVSHHYQGTVFGANIILSSFLGATMAPSAAVFEVLLGYVNVLIFSGLGFLALSALFSRFSLRWKF